MFGLALLLAQALGLGGCCAGFRCPLRIDPTGERVFAPADAPPIGAPRLAPFAAPTSPDAALAPPSLPPGAVAVLGAPAPVQGLAFQQPGLSITPTQIVAPIGSEVVLVAGIMGPKGYLLERERIEWMLNPGDPGHFVQLGQNGLLDCLNHIRGLPKKVDATYAINATSTRPVSLSRGSPSPLDDMTIHTGQAWVSISSPAEGLTRVTAYAPTVDAWDRRQQNASIYWVDAQWAFPSPAITPVGGRHLFTTSVTRQSDGSPASGYVVRYEIQGGPDAGFAPDGASAVEVTTNELGQASAEIVQKQPSPGANQIGIQVIRPAGVGGGGRRLTLGAGSVVATWTSSQLSLRARGPVQAGVGAIATYRLEVQNTGGIPAPNVVLVDAAPPGLTYVNSTPAGDTSPSAQEWRLGDIAAGETRVVEANYRVVQPGSLQYCATATTGDGLSARDCVTTAVAEGRIEVRIAGPSSAAVGSEVQFQIEIINRADTPAAGLVITDNFDVGLEHSVSASPIKRLLEEDLQPGATRQIGVTFRVTRPGQLCHTVEITSGAALRATAKACLTAIGAAIPSAPLSPSAPLAPPASPPPSTTFAPRDPALTTPPPAAGLPESAPISPPPTAPAAPPRRLGPQVVTIRKTGPTQRRVGELAEFLIELTNFGDAPLENVRITDNYDSTLRATGATPGFDARGALVWRYSTVAPGQTIQLQVNCNCLAEATHACNRVVVTADGGVNEGSEACLDILPADNAEPPAPPERSAPPERTAPSAPRPRAPAAPPAPNLTPGNLQLSVIDDVDPARIGSTIVYRIAVTNATADSDRQVLVRVTLPTNLSVQAIRGAQATRHGDTLRFTPIAELRAGETVNYEIRARAIQAGEANVSADATSLRQPAAVAAEATTEVLSAQ